MGWQDRDYASVRRVGVPCYGPVGRHSALGGRSIVTILIIINLAVHFGASIFPALGGPIYNFGAMQPEAVLHGQVWRLVTAQYLHHPTWLMHILFNMIGLHFLGRPIERIWSPAKFFTIYTLCGVCGNLFLTFLGVTGAVDLQVVGVGASGSVLGLLGIVAVLFPNARVLVFFVLPMKVRTAALLLGAIAYVTIVQRGANYGGEACHLAGLAFGAFWAFKGDAWWSSSGRARWAWLKSIVIAVLRPTPKGQDRGKRVGRTRVGGFADKIAQRREDEVTIDRILRKVYEKGIHSLTESEKTALKSATERQKIREAQAGRTDRL